MAIHEAAACVWDSSPAMAKLYDGLPVVRVRDWAAVTPAFLEVGDREMAGVLCQLSHRIASGSRRL